MKITATLTNEKFDYFNQHYKAGIVYHTDNKNCIYGTLTAILNAKSLSQTELDILSKRFGCKYLLFPHQILLITKAKATCNPDDTFDFVKGKRIVESRCKEKLYRKIKKMLQYVYDYRVYNACDFYDNVLHYDYLIIKEEQHIDKLTQ